MGAGVKLSKVSPVLKLLRKILSLKKGILVCEETKKNIYIKMNQKSKIDLTSPILPARKPINEKQLSSSSSLLPLCKLI